MARPRRESGSIPSTVDLPDGAAALPPDGTDAGTPPINILVADDEEGILTLLATILTYAGFTVTDARDGREALARAREKPPRLALLDVMMPGMDGREVCRRMSADPALTHVPVILHSSADEREIDWRACGADAFLQKPFKVSDVPDLVRRYLGSRDGTDPRARASTDDEIRQIALQIRDAIRRPPPLDPRDRILSAHRELSPDDEARVERALLELFGKRSEHFDSPAVDHAVEDGAQGGSQDTGNDQ